MGVILDFVKMRLKDVENELDAFLEKPLKYILDRQTLRKALLLEWLDNVRPVIGTKYEHWIQEVKG
jgi:hypothetical protein